MEVRLAVAKTHKYAVAESGDTLEVTERPQGGISLLLADGQGSGRSAKQNSNMIVAKGVAMIGEGARDGAVARALHDMLYAARNGRVSAELLIVSADAASQTFVISRNTACPVLVYSNGDIYALPGEASAIGVRLQTKPLIDILPLAPVTTILGFSDGIWLAGRSRGQQWGQAEITQLLQEHAHSPEGLVEAVLAAAAARDAQRPGDDMSVFAVSVLPRQHTKEVRRLTASFPL